MLFGCLQGFGVSSKLAQPKQAKPKQQDWLTVSTCRDLRCLCFPFCTQPLAIITQAPRKPRVKSVFEVRGSHQAARMPPALSPPCSPKRGRCWSLSRPRRCRQHAAGG